MSRGGARPGAGRKPSGEPLKKLSIAPHLSEYDALKNAAALAGKTLSRFVIDAAMEKARILCCGKRVSIPAGNES